MFDSHKLIYEINNISSFAFISALTHKLILGESLLAFIYSLIVIHELCRNHI